MPPTWPRTSPASSSCAPRIHPPRRWTVLQIPEKTGKNRDSPPPEEVAGVPRSLCWQRDPTRVHMLTCSHTQVHTRRAHTPICALMHAHAAHPHTHTKIHTHMCTPPRVLTPACKLTHTHKNTLIHAHRTRCSHTHMHTHTHKCAHGMLARPRAHWHTSHARAHPHTFPPSPWPETPRSPPGMGRADVCPAPRPLSAARRQRRPDSRGRRAALRFTEREAAAGSPALSYLWQK